MKRLIITLVLTCSLGILLTAQHSNEEIEAIKEQSRLFSQYFVEGNTAALVDIYSDNGKIFPSDRPILEGRDSLMAYWTPAPDRKWRLESHKVVPEEITLTSATTAYDYGYYYGVSSKLMVPAEKSEWKGKYVIIWKKDEEGTWRIYIDIWNRVKE